MNRRATLRPAREQEKHPDRTVTIVGAGIAGLTAALELAQSGFQVTVLEASDVVGGNLADQKPERGEPSLEVYPHMFGDWYNNFWRLIAELDIVREKAFERRPVCGFLRRNDFPNYRLLDDNGSFRTLWANLFSGIMPPHDMILAAYAVIDLLTQDFDGDDLASEQTLNGFLVTRPYMTDGMVEFFRAIILNIWSVDSYVTSALAFQSFAKFQFRKPSPQCWVLKESSGKVIIDPLVRRLKALGVLIKTNAKVTGIRISVPSPGGSAARKVTHLSTAPGDPVTEVENLILAVRPTALLDLISTPAQEPAGSSPDLNLGTAIIGVMPELASTRRLATAPIPVVYVTFRKALPNIPNFYVALTDSRFSLSFVKIGALVDHRDGKTVLAVAASDHNALSTDIQSSSPVAKRHAMESILDELRTYVPFDAGDIDWDNTYLKFGPNQELFLNQVGSRRSLPLTDDPRITNLFFAGENRDNPIVITTVEASVCSGLQAAEALCRQQGVASAHPIAIVIPKSYPSALVLAWKLAFAPHAAAAKCWAVADNLVRGRAVPASPTTGSVVQHTASLVLRSAASAADAYCQWWNVLGSAAGQIARGVRPR